MSVESDIRDGLFAIARMALGDGANSVFSAEVTKVDVTTRSCSVTSISSEVGMDYDTVWLMAQVADGVLYVPKVGSTVIVCNNASLQPFVIAWTEIDEILYVVGDATFSMKTDLTKFNDGDNDGLANVKPIATALSDLQKDINKLKQAFAAWTPVANDGGAALKASLSATYPAAPLTVTQQSDIEDTKVTH